MKNLFIPLKREYFEAFENGIKRHEYRQFGKRWNRETCIVGRPVTLSCGYGKQHRLSGIIKSIEIENEPHKLPGWYECYGMVICPAIIIEIKPGSAKRVLIAPKGISFHRRIAG